MEEILASIKRVIADDGRLTPTGARAGRRTPRSETPAPATASATLPEDVLELDDPLAEDGTLVSEDAAAASRQSLAALTAVRQGSESPLPRAGEGALEAVIRDMLRPMLKEWLDQHLPEIVEDLVSREVARITGRSL